MRSIQHTWREAKHIGGYVGSAADVTEGGPMAEGGVSVRALLAYSIECTRGELDVSSRTNYTHEWCCESCVAHVVVSFALRIARRFGREATFGWFRCWPGGVGRARFSAPRDNHMHGNMNCTCHGDATAAPMNLSRSVSLHRCGVALTFQWWLRAVVLNPYAQCCMTYNMLLGDLHRVVSTLCASVRPHWTC